MADHGEVEYATADGNDYAEHESTYAMFIALTKWGIIFLVILLALMAYFLVSPPPPGGSMKTAVPAEVDAAEPRVAATPDTIKKLKALGADIVVETGAGVKSGILDADYEAAGASIGQ